MQRFRFLKAMLVAALLLLPISVFAQAGATYTSGFQIQNLSPTDQADVTIDFYNQDGTKLPLTKAIPAGSAIFVLAGEYPTGFSKGSVVITSNVPVAAVTNVISTDNAPGTGQQFASYNGFSIGSDTINIPLILSHVQDPNGFLDSWFSVQNAGSTPATINVTYFGAGGETFTEPAKTVAPGVAVIYDQSERTDLRLNGQTYFVGSAVVTGGGVPLVASVQQKTGASLLSFDAFVPTQGNASVSIPLVMANNFQSFTGIQVQNTSTTGTTNITIDYAANAAVDIPTGGSKCEGDPPNKVFNNVAARASVTALQNGAAGIGDGYWASCTYVGAATITSDNGAPLVAIVNQVGPSLSSAYEGFNPTLTTQQVKIPLVQAHNGGIFSGLQVQNTGGTAATVLVDYGPNVSPGPGGTSQNCGPLTDRTVTVQPGASKTFLQVEAPGTQPGAPYDGNTVYDPQFLDCTYVGSVTVSTTTAGANLAAILNQVVPGYEEILTTYNGFNQ